MKEDREIQEFRDLMKPPERFEDGFSFKSVVGAVFVGIIMLPGAMYMGLVAGADIGPAARWVTVILFIEVARRSFATLRRPEIFVLYYMAGAVVTTPFWGPLWNQFFIQSQAARDAGLDALVPIWAAPNDPAVLAERSFFMAEWFWPLLLLVGTQLLWRIDHFGLGYVLYRITSDVERLPFPLAPVGAMGITALAESSSGKETWRWQVFSIGGMLGLLFGAVYIGVPQITGVILHKPIQAIPIPWVELTDVTEDFLPATPMAVSLDLSHVIIGMVLPFWAMVGQFIGFVIQAIANPIMYHTGLLHSWSPGTEYIKTAFVNSVDFYFSFTIGISVAVAVIGFYHVFQALRRGSRDGGGFDWSRLLHPPAGRGDFSILLALGIYVFSTVGYILLCRWLVPDFPSWVLVVYGFGYVPVISYVMARMEGVVGQQVQIPMVREAMFILSGYKGVGIWFAPIPQHDYPNQVVSFRQVELTGTRLTSIIKTELVIFPIVIVSTLVFAQFIWRLAPIPSPAYPYAQKMWELQAYNQVLMMSSTVKETSIFYEAFKPWVVCLAGGLGLGTYSLMAKLGLPVMLVYGTIRGLGNALPHAIIPNFIGALIGRRVFQKRFGLKWRQYAPVLLAGFMCGMGLVSMLALGVVFLSKAVYQDAF